MAETTSRPVTAASYNQYIRDKKLMGSRCQACEQVFSPPRAICPTCHSADLDWSQLSGKGKLATFTAIHIGPSFMNQQGFGRDNPYVVGIVELEEGPMVSARILDVDAKQPETIQIGMPVEADFLETGDEENAQTSLVFRPVEK